MINDECLYDQVSSFSGNVANTNFILNNDVVEKYHSIYSSIINKERKSYLFKNIIPLLYYINAFRRAQKK
jgi:hypothetical protein